jgi:hypothetical protein
MKKYIAVGIAVVALVGCGTTETTADSQDDCVFDITGTYMKISGSAMDEDTCDTFGTAYGATAKRVDSTNGELACEFRFTNAAVVVEIYNSAPLFGEAFCTGFENQMPDNVERIS